jgi:NAD-dependent histone deacetylase SIR2
MNLSAKDWTEVANRVHKSKRIVFITGAGISVSGGIPDFRSSNGLYDLVKQKYPNQVVKGKELFDASLFKDPIKTKLFYTFISQLKQVTQNARPTKTHEFLKRLQEDGKLLRIYTQNIDDLDKRSGLDIGYTPSDQVVQMHGELETVKCTLCSHSQKFDQQLTVLFEAGTSLPCPNCTDLSEARKKNGRRAIGVGILRPNIVLYNEHHEKGEAIAALQNTDLKRADLLIVMGTSLKIVGVKQMIKAFKDKMTMVNSMVLFVNKTPAPKEWEEVFDYQLLGDADESCIKIAKRLDLLQKQAEEKRIAREQRKIELDKKKQREKNAVTEITKYFKAEKPMSTKTKDLRKGKVEGSDENKVEKNESRKVASAQPVIVRGKGLVH